MEINKDYIWNYLKNSDLPIILYGMGDGADKVLSAFKKYGITASGVMASDDFVRGQSFHEFTVKKLSDFENEYSVMPAVDRRTKAGKAEYQRFVDELGSRTPVSQGLFDEVSAMASAVKAHPAVKKLLCGGKAEESFFWDENGIECKCRPDYLKNKIAVDLKSTSDASPAAFEKSAYNYRYHVQAWWYLHGLNKCGIEVTDFIFIAFEKNPPYAVCIYAADDLMLELGEREAMKNLEAYRQSSKTGIWYGYEKDALIHSLSLPDWVVRKEF